MIERVAYLILSLSGTYLAFRGFLFFRRLESLQKILAQHTAYRADATRASVPKIQKLVWQRAIAWLGNRVLVSQAIAVVTACASGLLFLNNSLPLAGSLLLIAIVLFLFAYVAKRQRRRKNFLFKEQMPEAIEIIVRGARVGLSLEETFRIVGEDMPAPIGTVFQSMAEKQRLGQELSAVLASMSARIDIKEFHFLAVTLIVQQQSGGQYSNILLNLGNVLRNRQAQEKRLSALTAEARWSAKAIALITVCLTTLIAFTNEAHIEFLVNEEAGRGLLVYAVVSISLGFVIISLLLRSVKR